VICVCVNAELSCNQRLDCLDKSFVLVFGVGFFDESFLGKGSRTGGQ
jgi:hypothetical protein